MDYLQSLELYKNCIYLDSKHEIFSINIFELLLKTHLKYL